MELAFDCPILYNPSYNLHILKKQILYIVEKLSKTGIIYIKYLIGYNVSKK